MSITFYTSDKSLDVNMSNTNAYNFWKWLGLDMTECCGEITVGELKQALEDAALGVISGMKSDNGLPMLRVGNFIDCGRADGLFEMRMRQFHEAIFTKPDTEMVYWA